MIFFDRDKCKFRDIQVRLVSKQQKKKRQKQRKQETSRWTKKLKDDTQETLSKLVD